MEMMATSKHGNDGYLKTWKWWVPQNMQMMGTWKWWVPQNMQMMGTLNHENDGYLKTWKWWAAQKTEMMDNFKYGNNRCLKSGISNVLVFRKHLLFKHPLDTHWFHFKVHVTAAVYFHLVSLKCFVLLHVFVLSWQFRLISDRVTACIRPYSRFVQDSYSLLCMRCGVTIDTPWRTLGDNYEGGSDRRCWLYTPYKSHS